MFLLFSYYILEIPYLGSPFQSLEVRPPKGLRALGPPLPRRRRRLPLALSNLFSKGTQMVHTLSVQSTHIWSMYGFSVRNRNYGLRYILHIWVLGPLGKGPCSCLVHVWALRGFLQPYFMVCLCTIIVLGPILKVVTIAHQSFKVWALTYTLSCFFPGFDWYSGPSF